ncbi:hypothetical protein [Salmonella enterica]|uniref:hypothetical protein n=1 Tax=Salmonella enterica TaxID=28901 RepID=UPI001FD1DDAD|nr:hypothetical protein [Salmonella enterica]
MKRYTHDLETDLNDVDKTPSLIHKTLLTASTIYDLKYLAQVLNDENGSNWSRASLKRQVTCIPEHCELSIADGVTNGAIVIHTQRLKSDPGGNLLS